MAEADERDNGRGLHEIEMLVRAAQERPGAVAERSRGTERDQGIHVRTAGFQLPPGASIKRRPGVNLHDTREGKGSPLKPRGGAELKNPFACHQKCCDDDSEPQAQLPVFARMCM